MIPETTTDGIVEIRTTITNAEAVELFTALNIERDRRFDQARTPKAVKDALAFHQLVARLHTAYIRGNPIETVGS